MTPIQPRFPELFAGTPEARHARITAAISLIEDGAAGSRSVRTVEFKEANQAVSFYIAGLFNGHLSKDDAKGLDFWSKSNTPMNLHEIIGFHSRVSKVQSDGSRYIIRCKTIADELMPLAVKAAQLRPNLTKGRDTSKQTRDNPDKIGKTCPCCFRPIAVDDTTGKMVLHGYKRPGHGYTLGRCFGVGFPDLETSSEGLIAFIAFIEQSMLRDKSALDRQDDRTEIEFTARDNPRETHVVRKGDPDFPRHLESIKDKLRLQIASHSHQIRILKTKLTEADSRRKNQING